MVSNIGHDTSCIPLRPTGKTPLVRWSVVLPAHLYHHLRFRFDQSAGRQRGMRRCQAWHRGKSLGVRHTAATLVQGVHPKLGQEPPGHSQIAMTLDTYSHVLPSMQRDAAVKLASVVERQGRYGPHGHWRRTSSRQRRGEAVFGCRDQVQRVGSASPLAYMTHSAF
jgi:hypothetical protein